jgi:CheY-like chemotaxis protein
MSISREEIHEALQNLYNGLTLGQMALAARLPGLAPAASPAERAQRLRALLLDAIELLQPPRPATFRSPAARSYQVMTLHLVEGLPMGRVAEELSISERQAYRDLLRAEEGLAELLSASSWEALAECAADKAPSDIVAQELENLPAQSAALEVGALLDSALETVSPLAVRLGGTLDYRPWRSTLFIYGSQPLLRQTLVQMLSAALRHAADRRVTVGVQAVAECVTIDASFRLAQGSGPQAILAALDPLARAQQLLLDVGQTPQGLAQVRISLPRKRRRVVLVLEDNPSAVELYRRYLEGSDEWELAAGDDPRRAFELARETCPAVIVLDVLMPLQDGWQVLQRLRAQPETHPIPVLICSVFDEAALALALGASGYLKKPVSREQFVQALQDCLSPRHNRLGLRPTRS